MGFGRDEVIRAGGRRYSTDGTSHIRRDLNDLNAYVPNSPMCVPSSFSPLSLDPLMASGPSFSAQELSSQSHRNATLRSCAAPNTTSLSSIDA